ncbi:MAG: cyclic nucleotide-binding domain-containing protein [Acidobacteriota bacterium]|nr:cyclic nucleotide-binding domain-containing protein [Acidobacteriota bacterium]
MTLRTRLQRYAPLFSEMDRETLCAVVEVMACHRLEAGEVIFRQGDAGDSLFIITSGEVALTVEGADKEPIELQRLSDGACFGEVSALSRLPRNVSAIATTPTEVLELSRDYLEAVSIAHPQVWTILERFQQRRLVPVGC